ncbi:N-acetyl-D-Glu racemase DgcA [Bordetella flabilis]
MRNAYGCIYFIYGPSCSNGRARKPYCGRTGLRRAPPLQTMPLRSLHVQHCTYPIRGVFRISRGSKTQADAVILRITEDGYTGRGECIPYGHYGESVASVIAQIEAIAPMIRDGMDVDRLQSVLPAGAARNAVDCALWDLRSRMSGVSVSAYAGLPGPLAPVQTAFTISLDSPATMAVHAYAHRHMPMLKLKLGGEGDDERVLAVRSSAPSARLIADANESWAPEHLERYLPLFASLGLELLEQPLPAGADDFLSTFKSPVPLAADESCRDANSIPAILGKYSIANIKLDKSGGLTEALRVARGAREAGLGIMVGCMVGSSLSMAPGIVLAQCADFVHLDGPLLLESDITPALPIDGATLSPDAAVWAV